MKQLSLKMMGIEGFRKTKEFRRKEREREINFHGFLLKIIFFGVFSFLILKIFFGLNDNRSGTWSSVLITVRQFSLSVEANEHTFNNPYDRLVANLL
jgi:hypothetical protein